MFDVDTKFTLRKAIENVAVGPDRGRDISRVDAEAVMHGILNGEVDEVQTAVLLIALRMKRESRDEFLGLFDALQSKAETSIADVDEVFCLADPFDGYGRTATITPFIPPVLAACGMSAFMHGVEAVGPKYGVTAHKVYKAAGIEVLLSPREAAKKLKNIGWTYVDQSRYLPALYRLESLRDRIVKRTALTTLERVVCPIRGQLATHLILGYVHKAYPAIYAAVATAAKFNSILLFKGVEGGLAPALNKPLRRYFVEAQLPYDIDNEKQVIETAKMFNRTIPALQLEGPGEPVKACLALGLQVLSGIQGPARDSLSFAAGQILFTHRRATSLAEAVENVQYCLDNGSAKRCFQAMIGNID